MVILSSSLVTRRMFAIYLSGSDYTGCDYTGRDYTGYDYTGYDYKVSGCSKNCDAFACMGFAEMDIAGNR